MNMTPTPDELHGALFLLLDELDTVGEDYLRPSPSRRAPRRDPDERKAPASSKGRRPTEDIVFDERRMALADARTRALAFLLLASRRLDELRENLHGAHAAWLGNSDLDHITES